MSLRYALLSEGTTLYARTWPTSFNIISNEALSGIFKILISNKLRHFQTPLPTCHLNLHQELSQICKCGQFLIFCQSLILIVTVHSSEQFVLNMIIKNISSFFFAKKINACFVPPKYYHTFNSIGWYIKEHIIGIQKFFKLLLSVSFKPLFFFKNWNVKQQNIKFKSADIPLS